jgi:hypothetical protein
MKKVFGAMSVMVLVTLLLSAWLPAAAEEPLCSVRLIPPPSLIECKPLVLAVDESKTFRFRVVSEVPYNFAAAKVDEYYPGRSISVQNDQAGKGIEALLEITITGKSSTVGLPAVGPWYGCNFSDKDVAPVAILAGARYPGGVSCGIPFPFAVKIP